MKSYFWFVAKRAVLLVAVIFFGVSATFFITHLSPISPVESALGRIVNQSSFSPDAIEDMRRVLTDLYGTDRPLLQQYLAFWQKLATGDLGPSLIAFPTPAMTLVMQALPWTVVLLVVSTVITFVIGNLLGAMAGYFQNNIALKAFGVAAVILQPIPYYVVAFVLLILFGFVWPVLPISGGYAMDVAPGWTLSFVHSVLLHAMLPAISLVLVGFGSWFLGMRALVSTVVTEDYVTYAELAGVRNSTIMGGYVIRNALIPQVTGLAMSLGAVFSGTIITEQVFNYPGLGSLLIDAVFGGDYALVLAVSTISIASVGIAIFIVDLLYPLIDPRVKAE
jgi:peptide/nickel transport system permease protein